MVLPVEDKVLVDLVGDGDDVVLATQLGDEREFVTSEHLARRIVRRVEKQRLRVRRERGPQFVGVEGPVGSAEGDHPASRATQCDTGGVGVVVGLEGDDLVARPGEGEHGGSECLSGTGGDQDLTVRVELLATEPGAMFAHRLTQRRDAW